MSGSLPTGEGDCLVFEETTLPYQLATPLMWLLVRWVHLKRRLGIHTLNNTLLFDGLGKSCRKIREGAASWRALEIIYNYQQQGGIAGVVDNFWINMRNAQAVRNRLQVVKRQLAVAAGGLTREGKPVRILSLAAGSAKGVLETVANLKRGGASASVLLVDVDEGAILYAQKMAKDLGLGNEVSFQVGNALRFEKIIGDFRPNIIEMLGFLDYLEDNVAKLLIKKIAKSLPSGGIFLTCHIHDNPEREFLTHVIDWGREPTMFYRSPEELNVLVAVGGFVERLTITEPHGIHTVIVARKK